MKILKESIDNVLPVVKEGLDVWLQQRAQLRQQLASTKTSIADRIKTDIREMFFEDGVPGAHIIPLEVEDIRRVKIGDVLSIYCYPMSSFTGELELQPPERFDIRWGNSSWGRSTKGNALSTFPLMTDKIVKSLRIAALVSEWATAGNLEVVIESIAQHLLMEELATASIKRQIKDINNNIKDYLKFTVTDVINPMLQFDMELCDIIPDYYNKRCDEYMMPRYRKTAKGRIYITYAPPVDHPFCTEPKNSSMTMDEWITVVTNYISTELKLS